jgi:hypothetical protein
LPALDELLFTAQKLFNEGNYSQAVEEYGKVMELIFMELCREYFPQLAYSEKEKVLNYEKSIGKAPEKFTLGEWVGLFRQTRFSDFIKNKKGITRDSLFFSYGIIDALVDIRNRALWLDLYLFHSYIEEIEDNFFIISVGRFKNSPTQLLAIVKSCISMGKKLEDAASHLRVEIGKLVVSTKGAPQSFNYKPFFTTDVIAEMEEQHDSILRVLATPS